MPLRMVRVESGVQREGSVVVRRCDREGRSRTTECGRSPTASYGEIGVHAHHPRSGLSLTVGGYVRSGKNEGRLLSPPYDIVVSGDFLMALAYGDYETAPCLRDGPLAESGRALVTATRELGRSRPAAIVRSWTVPFLYDGVAAILASDEYPTPRAVRLFERLGETLARLKDVRWDDVPVAGASAHAAVNDTDRDSHTAEHENGGAKIDHRSAVSVA